MKNVAETSVELRWSRGYDNHSPIGKYVIMGRSPLSSEWRKMRTGVCVSLTIHLNKRSILVVLLVITKPQ